MHCSTVLFYVSTSSVFQFLHIFTHTCQGFFNCSHLLSVNWCITYIFLKTNNVEHFLYMVDDFKKLIYIQYA